jgi:hypothetical protein
MASYQILQQALWHKISATSMRAATLMVLWAAAAVLPEPAYAKDLFTSTGKIARLFALQQELHTLALVRKKIKDYTPNPSPP